MSEICTQERLWETEVYAFRFSSHDTGGFHFFFCLTNFEKRLMQEQLSEQELIETAFVDAPVQL